MLVRIETAREGAVTVVGLHGELGADGVDELQRQVAGCPGEFELDLADLLRLDAVAAAYLAGLVHGGIRVRRTNPYLARLLPERARPPRTRARAGAPRPRPSKGEDPR